MTWWLDTAADTTSWHPYLLAQGFRFDNSTPGMAVDLHALHEQIATPPGLVILPGAQCGNTGALDKYLRRSATNCRLTGRTISTT